MANPDIVDLATFNYDNGGQATSTTTATLMTCAADTVTIIESLLLTSIDPSNDVTATVTHVQDGGSYQLASGMTVAAGTAVQLAERPFVVKETEYLTSSAGANGDLVITWHGRVLNDA